MSKANELFSNINFILKLVEFLLCLAALIFMYVDEQPGLMRTVQRDLIPVAIWGYGAVALCFLLVYIFNETHDMLEVCLTIFGALFHLIAGIIIFVFLANHNNSMSSSGTFFWILLGLLTLACAACCITDVVFKFKKK